MDEKKFNNITSQIGMCCLLKRIDNYGDEVDLVILLKPGGRVFVLTKEKIEERIFDILGKYIILFTKYTNPHNPCLACKSNNTFLKKMFCNESIL